MENGLVAILFEDGSVQFLQDTKDKFIKKLSDVVVKTGSAEVIGEFRNGSFFDYSQPPKKG